MRIADDSITVKIGVRDRSENLQSVPTVTVTSPARDGTTTLM